LALLAQHPLSCSQREWHYAQIKAKSPKFKIPTVSNTTMTTTHWDLSMLQRGWGQGEGSGLSVGGKTSTRLGYHIASRLLYIQKGAVHRPGSASSVNSKQQNSEQRSPISINDRDKTTQSTDHLIVIFVDDKIRCWT
jgi:hypothetical protein